MVKDSQRATMMNRRVLIKSGIAGAFTGFAGCTAGDGGDSDGGDGLDLTAWAFGPHADALKEVAKEWNDQSSNTVEAKEIDDIERVLANSLQSQTDLPSISLVRNSQYNSVSRQGGFIPLDDELAEFEDELYTLAKARGSVQGNHFNFPNDLGPLVMIYNTDIFDEAGVPSDPEDLEDEMETWEDWINIAETVMSETDAHMGAMMAGGTASQYAPMLMQQYGGWWYDSDGNFAYNQTANAKAWERIHQLGEYCIEGFARTGDTQDKFRNGEVAVHFAPAWSADLVIPSTFPEMDSLRIVRPPAAEDGLGIRCGNWGGAGASIPTALSDEMQQAAIEFGEFWHVSETGVNKKLEAGMFPAVHKPDAEAAQKEIEFYGGQKTRQKFMQVAEDSPPFFPPPNPSVSDLRLQSISALSETDDIQGTLDDYHEQMIDNMDEVDQTVPIEKYQ